MLRRLQTLVDLLVEVLLHRLQRLVDLLRDRLADLMLLLCKDGVYGLRYSLLESLVQGLLTTRRLVLPLRLARVLLTLSRLSLLRL